MNKVNRKFNWFYPFIPAISAGVFIALGAFGSQVAMSASNKVVSAFVFSIGLISVIFTQSELFTGNCLLFIPLLKKQIKMPRLLLHGLLVFIGNFIGSFLVAYFVRRAGLVPEIVDEMALAKTQVAASQLFIRGIFCNILVCAAVYFSQQADSTIGKIFSIMLPVALFVICGFEHSVANMYFIPVGGQMLLILNNLIPVTLGNIVGGFIFSWYIFNKESN